MNKGENVPKTNPPVTSSGSLLKKDINCFNCGYEGHYTHEYRRPKQQDRVSSLKAWLNALEVHESGPNDDKEPERDPLSASEQSIVQESMGDKAEFMDLMDLMDIYSMIDEEKDDDELISYLGAMHPIKEVVTKSNDKVIYCQMMNTTYGELPQGKLLPTESKGQQSPEDSIDKDDN